jgi:hypothetical protein
MLYWTATDLNKIKPRTFSVDPPVPNLIEIDPENSEIDHAGRDSLSLWYALGANNTTRRNTTPEEAT